jgi:hypothetical protein
MRLGFEEERHVYRFRSWHLQLCRDFLSSLRIHPQYFEKVRSHAAFRSNVLINEKGHWRTQRGVWGVQTPLPKLFRSFYKAEPNFQFRGKYILRT